MLFRSASGCSSLAPGASCTVSVTFTPTELLGRNATLTISGDGGSTPVEVDLAGNGVASAPNIVFDPELLPSFGDVVVNTTSAPQTITVSNTGNADLVITSIAPLLGTHFSSSDDCVNGAIAPGASCTITVTFTPTASEIGRAHV